MSIFSLRGRVAVVTGATQGLGLEMVRALLKSQATVAILARDEKKLNRAVKELKEEGLTVKPYLGDVCQRDLIANVFHQIESDLGGVDVLINNAGTRKRQGMATLNGNDFRAILETNVVAPYELCRIASLQMCKRGYGRIINITSIAGTIARPNDVLYPASKGALEALTRSMAADLGATGITVNAVAPGFFATQANQAMVSDPTVQEWLSKRTSLARWGDPYEIAGVVVFLASPAASYVTGQVIAVDGGYLAHF